MSSIKASSIEPWWESILRANYLANVLGTSSGGRPTQDSKTIAYYIPWCLSSFSSWANG